MCPDACVCVGFAGCWGIVCCVFISLALFSSRELHSEIRFAHSDLSAVEAGCLGSPRLVVLTPKVYTAAVSACFPHESILSIYFPKHVP